MIGNGVGGDEGVMNQTGTLVSTLLIGIHQRRFYHSILFISSILFFSSKEG